MACLTCRPQGWTCKTYQKKFPGCGCPSMCKPPHIVIQGSSSAGERKNRLLGSLHDLYGEALPLSAVQQDVLEKQLLQLSETVSDESPEFYKELANIYNHYNLDIAVLEAQSSAIEVTAKPEARIATKLEMGVQLRKMEMYTSERKLYKEITQNILPKTKEDAIILSKVSKCYADSFRAERRISDADFAAHQAEQWRIAANNLPD